MNTILEKVHRGTTSVPELTEHNNLDYESISVREDGLIFSINDNKLRHTTTLNEAATSNITKSGSKQNLGITDPTSGEITPPFDPLVLSQQFSLDKKDRAPIRMVTDPLLIQEHQNEMKLITVGMMTQGSLVNMSELPAENSVLNLIEKPTPRSETEFE